jgi:hypothetical protein
VRVSFCSLSEMWLERIQSTSGCSLWLKNKELNIERERFQTFVVKR